MPREIETYKSVMINNIFGNNETQFQKNIYIEFIPDEIVLKYIAVADNNLSANLEEGSFLLRTDLIDNRDLIAFPASTYAYAEAVDIPFRNYNNINGTYTFNLSKIDGSVPAEIATMNMSLSLVLLFIKFKSN